MTAGMYIRLEKLGATVTGLPACPMVFFSPGAFAGKLSLPVTYWMEGYLTADLVIHSHIELDRRVRHGVVCRGRFTSSPITAIRDGLVVTYNSHWQVRRVPPLVMKRTRREGA